MERPCLKPLGNLWGNHLICTYACFIVYPYGHGCKGMAQYDWQGVTIPIWGWLSHRAQGKIFIVSTMFTRLDLHMVYYPRHHPNHNGKWSLQAPCYTSVVVKTSGCHVLFRFWARGSCPPKFCAHSVPIKSSITFSIDPLIVTTNFANCACKGMLQPCKIVW